MFQLAPINLSPINKYIDVTDYNIFYWECIGSTPTHATISFYDKSNSSTPLFNKTYIIDNISIDNVYSTPVYSSTLTNENSYLWDITTYTGTSGKKSEQFLFYTHQKPTISIPIQSTISSIDYQFSANYTTYGNSLVFKYKFELYQLNIDTYDLVDNTDWIYSQNVFWNFVGLNDNKTYKIKVYIEDDLLSQNYKEEIFYVDYQQIKNGEMTIYSNDDEGYVLIKTDALYQNFGNYYKNGLINSTPLFVDGLYSDAINIEPNSYVIFQGRNLNDFTFNIDVKMPNGFIGDICELSNGQIVGFDGKRFYLKIEDYISCSDIVKNPYNDWTKIQEIYGNIFFKNSTQQLYIGSYIWENISYLNPESYYLAYWSLTTLNGNIYRNPK